VIGKAVNIIDTGAELKRWADDGSLLKKREQCLLRLKAQLLATPPPTKKLPKVLKHETDWEIGELISYQLESGDYLLFRVIGYHNDKGGRFPVCELLDWKGLLLPPENKLPTIPIRVEATPRRFSQFMLSLPKGRKALPKKLRRTGIKIKPAQKPGGYASFPWKYLDRMLNEIFALS